MERAVSDDDLPYAFAAIEVISVETIDSGRTFVVRLRRPDGGDAVMLLSMPLAQDLVRQITDKLNGSPEKA
ncbi:MAG: hypothetical protein EOP09_05270 [Proteobacteria bacterium]|nr:MAG: hypothetical protein EOP09_05270 [Pseudomonadota bacterium]